MLFKPLCFLVILSLLLVGCSSINKDESVDQYLFLGNQYKDNHQYEKALKQYYQAAEIEPDNPEIYYKIGLLYGFKHSQRASTSSIIGGRRNRLDRVQRKAESDYSLTVKYLNKAAELGHKEAYQVLRVFHQNIQHKDVKY